MVSADKTGIVEYWTGPKTDYKFPKNVTFDSKLDTDLFDFVKNKTYPLSIAFPPEGNKMAILSADRKVKTVQFIQQYVCSNIFLIVILCFILRSVFLIFSVGN